MPNEKFVVRVDRDKYLKEADGSTLTVTNTPSYGLLMSYNDAVCWIARLQRRGYREAVITDAAGNLMTSERIRQTQQASRQVESTLPRTLAELDRIPAEECRRRYRTEAAFAERVDALSAQN